MAADAGFVQGTSGASASAASSTRSARETVLFRLIEGPMTPQEVSEGTKVGVGKAHRTLNELQGRDLVELIVPENASNGPIFGLTVQGEKVAFHIQRQSKA
ncbi:MarR family transcriptional regulator [Halobacteriales archaeon QS_7_68_65]|nr:MAG: MarR family transcriptional regulator [Halobacteriales archaeon QS_7_68_65]